MPSARILVVEDESIIALDIQNQLKRMGYESLGAAATGETAVQQALALKPDLILMDIRLQGQMDGIAAAEQIQAQLDVPIVYLTAYADEATLQRAKVTSPLGYLLKPFEERDLDTIIQIALYRHQTEKKLRASEAQYRTLFEHSPDAILVLLNRQIKLVNPAGVKMFGAATADDLIGRHLADMTTQKCLVDEDSANPHETTFFRLDGSEVIVECTAVPSLYEDQQALHIVARDITARKRAEAVAQQQRALTEALSHTAAQLVSSLEEETILQSVLEVIERVLPHDGSGIILFDNGTRLPRVLASDTITAKIDIQTAVKQHWSVIQAHYQKDIENQESSFVANENPEWAKILGLNWIQSLVTAPIRTQDKFIGFVVLVSNQPHFYTEQDMVPLQAFADQVAIALQNAQLYQQVQQYAAELERRVVQRTAELDQERGRLQAILDAAGEGIYLTDVAGNLLYVNPAIERITGYSWEELQGKTAQIWHSAETPAQAMQEMTQAQDEGRPWKGEVVNRRKDGQTYDASLSINPVRDRHDKLQGFVCAQRDITSLKELARLKDAFASQIGHELRTPITNIRLYHDLLTRKPEHFARYMEILQRETDRLANLVEGFIEISLLNADALPIKRVHVTCGEVAQQLVQRYEQYAEQRQITLEARLDAVLPQVLTDVDLLYRAMQKLLENALQYTPTGGRVTVETAVTQSSTQEWVTCTISDTGPGILPAEKPYLFERFYRGRVTQDLNVPGAGLGLSICREIMNKLGGHVTVSNQPGLGATFTLWLPQEEKA